MKDLDHRSYSSKYFRPKPEIYFEENGYLLIIATPWGERTAAETTIQTIQDYFLTSQGDLETTSPFEYMDCLSPAGNDLRVAVKLANDKIYKNFNAKEYTAGVELLVMAHIKGEIIWTQIGHPAVMHSRDKSPLSLLGMNVDLSMNISDKKILSPLPNNLLGVYETSNFQINSFHTKPGDKFLLVSRSYLPKDLYKLTNKKLNIDSALDILTKDSSENPFWVCSLAI